MKKFIISSATVLAFITLLSTSIFLFGCNSSNGLSDYVSELKSDIFYGESQNFTVKAHYGFIENPLVNDGKVGTVENVLTFRLLDKETENTTYSVSLSYDGKDYKSNFKLHPVNDTLTATILLDDFKEKEFTVTILSSSQAEEILLKSILPENTIDYKTALTHLSKDQIALIKHYTDSDGNFKAEIHIRVIVKDDKPYYYVGFASGNDKLKALLVDGLTGETLAIRDIF